MMTTAEVFDLKVDRHQTPMVATTDSDGKTHRVPV